MFRRLIAILFLAGGAALAESPALRIAAVRKQGPGAATVAVRGTVTMRPGTMPSAADAFYIQDDSGAISIHPPAPIQLSYNDYVECEGTVHALEENEPELDATRVTILREVKRLRARDASIAEIVNPAYGGQLLRLKGVVAKTSIGDQRDDIWVRQDDRLLRCYLRRTPMQPSVLLTQAPLGAEVEVVGLALPSPGEAQVLRLRESIDLTLVRRPYTLSPGAMIGLGVVAIIAVAAVGWSVTLRRSIRKQTAEIRGLLEKAKESSRLKSEFLANLSHEIRTPIHGIQGMHALLLDSSLTEQQKEELTIAQESARHLLSLLDDVVDLSRIEAGRLVLESVPLDPGALLRRAARSFETVARQKNLALECIPGELPARAMGDPTRLRQVLFNLLNNAVKFTDSGSIRVEAWTAEQADGHVRIGFRVADTGIGIPAEKQAAIFESFRQVDGTISRRYGGSGLGLAISRKLVRQMGGDLVVRSEAGAGSAFEFTALLGVASGDAPEAPESDSRHDAPAAVSPLRVLVAEDNEVNQHLVCRILEKDGHKVTLVSNGAEAVEAADREPFDVVLMDVQMPGMDGLQAAIAIRRHEQEIGAVRRPIFALTAHSMAGDREKCLAAGMDACLTKPFLPEDLRALLGGVTGTAD